MSTLLSARAGVQELVRALQSLPNNQHALLELLLFEGLRMAEALGHSINTCKAWKTRGLAVLRDRLGPEKIPIAEAVSILYELGVLLRAGVRALLDGPEPAAIDREIEAVTRDATATEIQSPASGNPGK